MEKNFNTLDNKSDSKLKIKHLEVKNEKENIHMDTEKDDEIEDGVDPKSSKFLKRGRLFIRNLPFSITEQKLRDLFSPFGEIKDFNLPYDENKKMLKGYCFIQYETKKEALIARSQLNGKKLDRREIQIEIAKPKNEYSHTPLPKIEIENKTINKRSKSLNDTENSNNKIEADEKKTSDEGKKNLENDPTRTLFIRNLGFDTEENSLKNLFFKYGKLKYCLICRNKETRSSKGSGFIMFEKKEDLESVLKIYDKYETNKDYSGINPFELDGRNLKLFRSVSKNEAVKSKEEKKENKENTDNRNRELLYYGLNNYYDFTNKDEVEVSENDKMKREGIIQLKKMNFKKNPNLHVSETRLVLRNLDKTFTEETIKELLREKTEKFMEILKKTDPNELKGYMKVKKIKQVKLMKDDKNLDKNNNPKSKNVAFIEVCDKNFAKWIINNLSNTIVKGKKKGLIIDFCLDDFRKIRNRLIKLDKLKLMNKDRNKENEKKEKKMDKKNTDKKKDRNKKIKIENNESDKKKNNNDDNVNENSIIKEKGTSIDQIKDVEKLSEMYRNSISRGKRQRIRKRIIDLGHTVDILGKSKELNFGKIDKNLIQNKNTFFDKKHLNEDLGLNENKIKKQDSYTVVRIDNEKDNMNYNKKIKQNLKDIKNKKNGKKDDKNILNKKRGRNNKNDESIDKNKNNFKKEKSKKIDRGYDDNDEMQMSGYIEQIERNLRKAN
jgi:RNA recognition motif-containing protein